MCMVILRIRACCGADLGVHMRLTCGSPFVARIFRLPQVMMSVFVV